MTRARRICRPTPEEQDLDTVPGFDVCINGPRKELDRLLCTVRKAEQLEAVMRSLISSGGTTPIIKAMAMNALEPGSGDAWLRSANARETKP